MSVDLTEKQHALLRRLIDGIVPFDVSYAERSSARALERRGLVTIGGSGHSWCYEVTLAGRQWKPPESATQCESQRMMKRPAGAAGPLRDLMDKVLAAGGTLSDKDDANGANGIITAGLRVCDMPGNHVLWIHHVAYARVVEAVPRPEWMVVGAEAITVPERVTRFHPVVRELRETGDFTHAISATARGRASRILHAIATAAQAYGWRVSYPVEPGWHRTSPGILRLSVGDASRDLHIREDC